MTSYSRLLLLFFSPWCCVGVLGQVTEGRIVYERKTNLLKKYKDEEVRRWIPEGEKSKVDTFELFFNDSLTYFGPVENDLKERLSWTTQKNKVYQDLRRGSRHTILNFWGDEVHMTDSLRQRTWKILPGKRTIAGYECHKAMWVVNDSLKVYAWYSDQVQASVGPESFIGLPGAILGLATEDGGVIYFAREITALKPAPEKLLPKKTKNDIFTSADLKAKLEKDFGKEPWGRAKIQEIFGIW